MRFSHARFFFQFQRQASRVRCLGGPASFDVPIGFVRLMLHCRLLTRSSASDCDNSSLAETSEPEEYAGLVDSRGIP